VSIDPEKAAALLSEHFDELGDGEFVERAARWSPELVEDQPDETINVLRQLPAPGTSGPRGSAEVDLVRPLPQHVPLRAYLASALTGLDDTQRQLIFSLSDAISLVCANHGIELYEPRTATDPVHHPQVRHGEVFHIDREQVLSRDLLVLLAHFPSTGAGQELDFALNGLVPTIVVAHSRTRVSRMISGVPNLYLLLTYDEPEQLRSELDTALARLRPLLVQRKLILGADDVNLVGGRIRELRKRQGLSRPALLARLGVPGVGEDWLEKLESSPDRIANPTLTQLRALAAALNTTAADLVEPDLGERVVDYLEAWASPRRTARAGGMTRADRNKVLRRVLLRVIDSLEDDD